MRLKEKRIYIADDEDEVLEALTIILEEEGAEVIGGIDGRKIFTSVSFGNPDCIIIDLYMPHSDGFDAIEAMKDFLSVDCPIIVLTGHATEENISRALELGAAECIKKPLKADELIDTVVRLIDDSS
jgi:two-component system, NtrC family, nitrogen regulation response regulator NtrX